MFSGNLLRPTHGEVIERVETYSIPVFLMLFLCCALVVYVYLRYSKRTVLIFSSLFSYGSSQQLLREGHTFFRSLSLSFFLIYMLCGGIFFSEIALRFGWIKNINEILLVFLSAAALGLLIGLRRLLSGLFGFLLKNKKALEDYFSQFAINIYVISLLLLLVCLLLNYSSLSKGWVLSTALSLLGLLYLLRLIKIISLGYMQYTFSVFHLVLYLCAVEILPLLVFVKMLTGR